MLRDQCQAFCQCSYCKNRKDHTTNAADPASVLLRTDGALCSKDELYLRTLNESLRGRSLMLSARNAHKFMPDNMLQSTRGDFVRAAHTIPVRRRDRLQELLILENKERIRAERQRRLARRAAGLPDETKEEENEAAGVTDRAVGTRDDFPFDAPDPAEEQRRREEEERERERERELEMERERERKREKEKERAKRLEETRLKSYSRHPYGAGVIWLPIDKTAVDGTATADEEPMDPALQYPGSTHNTYKLPDAAQSTNKVLRVSPVPPSAVPSLPAVPAAVEKTAAAPAKEPLPYKSSAALWRTTNQDKDLEMQRFLEFKTMQKNADKVYMETATKRNGAINIMGRRSGF